MSWSLKDRLNLHKLKWKTEHYDITSKNLISKFRIFFTRDLKGSWKIPELVWVLKINLLHCSHSRKQKHDVNMFCVFRFTSIHSKYPESKSFKSFKYTENIIPLEFYYSEKQWSGGHIFQVHGACYGLRTETIEPMWGAE